MKKLYLLIVLLISFSLYSQNDYEIIIPQGRYQVDTTNDLIICKIDLQQLQNLITYNTVVLSLGEDYEFIENPGIISHQESYVVENNGTQYDLFFSIFPMISIETELEIVDEPKRLASFVYADLEEIKTSLIGIELRGAFSQTFPKKTYDLEFWEDELGDDSRDMQFGNLREDDDWILDALYNEPLRLRAYSSHQLWLDIHAPYYLDVENEAKAGADVMYADLFLNNEYIGIYMISEQVDKKQLKLKGYNGDIRGELYKAESWDTGNITFTGLPDYNNSSDIWGGYELKLPDSDDIIDWENLYNFTDFVMNSNEGDFVNQISENLHIENAIDYFIFLNLLKASDNYGKNIYTAKYTQDEPYFFVPWDLDGVFGTLYTGENNPTTTGFETNGLFSRLFLGDADFSTANALSIRWAELRSGVLSNAALIDRLLGNYNLLNDNMVYAREYMVWQNYEYDEVTKDYMIDWLTDRLIYLDAYFNYSTLNVDTVATNADVVVYPNPAKNYIYVTGIRNDIEAYQIFNTQGALIQEGELDVDVNKIQLQNMVKGFYFLKLDKTVKKIIVN